MPYCTAVVLIYNSLLYSQSNWLKPRQPENWCKPVNMNILVSIHWIIVNVHIDYKVLLPTTKALQQTTDSLAAPLTGYLFTVIFERDGSEPSFFHCSLLTTLENQTLAHYWKLSWDFTPIYFWQLKGDLNTAFQQYSHYI